MKLFFLLFLSVFSFPATAQTAGADKVVSYHFGTNTIFGQAPEFFPQNVFGNPDTNATLFSPSSTENNLVSLGLNGWIVLEFSDNLIRDFSGSDFTVFENAFYYGGDTTKIWREPGIISVSKNGTDFVSFPYDSVSFSGCAGTKPTNGKADPQEYSKSGGNSFDLSEIGMDSIRFVRVEDRSRWVLGGNGFDLDAIVATKTVSWTSIKPSTKNESELNINNYPNPFNPSTTLEWNQINANSQCKVEVFTILGELVTRNNFQSGHSGKQIYIIDLSGRSSGIYFVVLRTENQIAFKQIQLIK